MTREELTAQWQSVRDKLEAKEKEEGLTEDEKHHLLLAIWWTPPQE